MATWWQDFQKAVTLNSFTPSTHTVMAYEKLIPKAIGNRKRDLCVRLRSEFGERSERLPDLCFSICRFSQVVFIPWAQPHTQSLFLFPIAFGINLIHFFNEKDGAAGNSIVCFAASIPCHAIWQCEECELFRRVQHFWQRKCERSAIQEGRN